MGVSPLLLKIIICVNVVSMLRGDYIQKLVISPYGAVCAALFVIFWYLASETDDEIAADGQLNIFLLILFSCLALLPDPRKTTDQ